MSANRKANLFKNTFLIKTRGSHPKALSFLTDSADKLNASTDPAIQLIYTAFLPHFDAYKHLNVAVLISEGTYKGKTNQFQVYLEEMKSKLKQWEGPIHSVFPEDSPTAIEIFPKKRNPFYKGNYEDRLISLKALSDKLLEFTGTQPSLVPVQADVAAYYALTKAARDVQQGKEGNTDELRSQREIQWKASMKAFWGIVWGGLLSRFYNEEHLLHDYFDLNIINTYRFHFSKKLTVVAGINYIEIPPHVAEKLNPNRKAVFLNDSQDKINLQFGFSDSSTAQGPVPINLSEGNRRKMNIGHAGWAPGRNFLVVNNLSTFTGSFHVEIKG
ncbi:MAG: hypothetical protein IPP77_13970 [Bacteroidetes bacterium]|nr:hypothetical protein [Bacteroidota bacterium]